MGFQQKERWIMGGNQNPTIDKLLAWVESAYAPIPPDENGSMHKAIRAILEQVRASEVLTGTIAEWLVEKRRIELEAIRAFVDRVEKRPLSAAADFQDGVYDELAAMSKEAGGVDERDR